MERYNTNDKEGLVKAIESLKKYRRADLIDDKGKNLLENLYTDLLPDDHILKKSLQDNTTFLIGRKGTGKSTIFLRIEQEFRKKKGYMPCYLDVKTLFESSRSESVPEYIDRITDKEFLEKYSVKRNFLRKTLTTIIHEVDKKVDTILKKLLSGKKSSNVKEELKKILDALESNEALKSIEIPCLQQVNVQTKSDKMVSDSYTLSDGMESSVSLDKIPTIKLQGNSGETSNESHSMGTIIEKTYSEILLKVLQISDFLLNIKQELGKIGIKHLVILLDDFSEIPDDDMKTFVDVILAPLNNWSDEFIKFKVAAYPGRVYYGSIDVGKIDVINLDFYNLYSEFDRDKMEEGAVNFTQRLLEKRVKYFCKGDISTFFDVKPQYQMSDYYQLLFSVSMNVPRVMGYILSFCYDSKILYDKPISKIDIEKAAEKYYETKVYPFFTEMTYSMMSINSKINYLQLKELLDNMIVKMQDIKKKITSGIYTSGAYLQAIPYSSHFYVKEIYNKYLETLELNFFISKYTEQSDRDGEKVSIYCLNYGLCQKKNLPWGKPQGGKYRKYFIQRPFNMSVVLNEFLMQGQAIYCTKCGATFTQEQLPLLEFSHFKCNRCQGQVVKTSMLTESIKNELKKFQNEELLPQTETRVLLFLCNQNIALYAKDIAEELDMSSQSVAQICKRLDTDYGYIYRARQGTDKYMYSATEKARGFYV